MSRLRLVVLASVVLLGGLAAYLASGREERAGLDLAEVSPAFEVPNGPPETTDEAPITPLWLDSGDDGIVVIPFRPEDGGESTLILGDRAQRSPTRLLRVHATREDGTPLGGAELAIFGRSYSSRARDTLAANHAPPPPEARLLLDDDGRAQLEAAASANLYFHVRGDGRDGVARVRAVSKTLLAAETPIDPLDVDIVASAPHTVSVVARYEDGSPGKGLDGRLVAISRGKRVGRPFEFTLGESGERTLVLGAMEQTWRDAEERVVEVALPGPRVIPGEIVWRGSKETKVAVTLPPSVTFSVELLNDDGSAPYVGDATVRCSIVNSATPKSATVTARARAGRADFFGMPLSGQLVLRVEARDRLDRFRDVILPATGGVAPSIQIPVGLLQRVLTMTLVSADGRPIPNFAVNIGPLDAPESYESEDRKEWRGTPWRRITTDASGRLTVSRDPRRKSPLEILHPRVLPETGALSNGTVVPNYAVVPITPTESLAVDLGIVSLSAISTLSSGTVVTTDLTPAEDVRVRLTRIPPAPSLTSKVKPQAVATVQTNAQGEFCFLGPDPGPGRFELLAFSKTGYADPIAIFLGDRDRVITWHRTGTIEGSVSLASPLAAAPRIAISGVVGPALEPVVAKTRSQGNDRFQAAELKAGVYEANVTIDGFPVFELKGIVVAEGETVRPLALQELVVGHDLSMGTIRVLNEQAAPLRGATVTLTQRYEEAGRHARRVTSNANGEATFLLHRHAQKTLDIRIAGFRSFQQKDPTFPSVVRMASTVPGVNDLTTSSNDATPRFVIRFKDRLPRLPSLESMRINLVRPEGYREPGEARPARPMSRRVRERARSVDLGRPAAGDWDLALELRGVRRSGDTPAARHVIPLGRVTVPDSREGEIDVPLTEDEVRRVWDAANR